MGGGYNQRHFGLIATSNSWRRYWLPLMWKAWERAGLFRPRATGDYLRKVKGQVSAARF